MVLQNLVVALSAHSALLAHADPVAKKVDAIASIFVDTATMVSDVAKVVDMFENDDKISDFENLGDRALMKRAVGKL